MTITLRFGEDDGLPCVCKITPILTAFPGVQIIVDPSHVGQRFAERLHRAQVAVEVKQGV